MKYRISDTRISTIRVSTTSGFRTVCSLLILLAVHQKMKSRGDILQYDVNIKFHENPAVYWEDIRGHTQICQSVFTWNFSRPFIFYNISTTTNTVTVANDEMSPSRCSKWLKQLIFCHHNGLEKCMLCHLLFNIYTTTSTLRLL